MTSESEEEFMRVFSEITGAKFVDVTPIPKDKHICCDGECNHDDRCGKVETNCPLLE